MYQDQWGERSRCVRSDNNTKFVNKTLDGTVSVTVLCTRRLCQTVLSKWTVAERINRTIMEKAQIMMHI